MITPDELTRYVADVASLTARGPRPPGLVYVNLYEFLACHGRVWRVAADQPEFPRVPCHPGYCFVNAYRLARCYPRRFRYVEGLAAGMIPVHHAWVVDRDDAVVDPTWTDHLEIGSAYLGVAFDLDDVRWVTSRSNASVLDNWQRRHPAFVAPWSGRVPRTREVDA